MKTKTRKNIAPFNVCLFNIYDIEEMDAKAYLATIEQNGKFRFALQFVEPKDIEPICETYCIVSRLRTVFKEFKFDALITNSKHKLWKSGIFRTFLKTYKIPHRAVDFDKYLKKEVTT